MDRISATGNYVTIANKDRYVQRLLKLVKLVLVKRLILYIKKKLINFAVPNADLHSKD